MINIIAVLIVVSGWSVKKYVDPMTDDVYGVIVSNWVHPISQPSSPYENLAARMVVKVSKVGGNQVFLEFNSVLNVTGGRYMSNTVIYPILARFDKKRDLSQYLVYQPHRGEDILEWWLDAEDFIERMKKHTTVLLGMEWYGQGFVYFRFNLMGFTRAYKKARLICGC